MHCLYKYDYMDCVNILCRTAEILKSAHRYGGKYLKRLVLLGSAVSVLNSFEDITREGSPYTEKSWNPVGHLYKILVSIHLQKYR